MGSQKVDVNFDLDLGHDGEDAIEAPALQRTTFKKAGFFSFENPGFVLSTWFSPYPLLSFLLFPFLSPLSSSSSSPFTSPHPKKSSH